MRAAVGEALHGLALRDPRIVFVGSDQGVGSMSVFQRAFPDRFYMEGISEQYVVGMAAGLAACGMLPYVQAIAAFLTRRAYEQIYVDLGLQNLPVRIIGSSAGLTHSALGPTHTAIDDIALMRNVPNMIVVSPRNGAEAAHWLNELKDCPNPVYLRLVHDIPCGVKLPSHQRGGEVVVGNGPLLVVSTGATTHSVADACALLADRGLKTTLLHLPKVHPLEPQVLLERAAGASRVVVVEEHLPSGGLATAVQEALTRGALRHIVTSLGASHAPPLAYGTPTEAREAHGLSGTPLIEALARLAEPASSGI
jgi:transketolase